MKSLCDYPVKWMLMVVATAMPFEANAEKLITQVSGEARVRLPGYAGSLPLRPGTLLPGDADLQFLANTRVNLVCTSNGAIAQADNSEEFATACPPSQELDTYRAGADTDYPVLLFPNQTRLSVIDKVIWGGAPRQYYQVEIVSHSSDGKKRIIFNSGKLALRPASSNPPVFVYTLKKPVPLEFQKKERYEVLITNLTLGKESRGATIAPQFIVQPSTSAEKKLRAGVQGNPSLKTLALAAQFYEKDLRYQAYDLLNSMNAEFRSQVSRLKGDLLRHPSIPFSYAASEYGSAMRMAHEEGDALNAVLACRELASDPLQLRKQQQLALPTIPKADLDRYCSE